MVIGDSFRVIVMKHEFMIMNSDVMMIKDLPPIGTGYIHYVSDLKTNDFLEKTANLITDKTMEISMRRKLISFLRSRRWLENNYPELLL